MEHDLDLWQDIRHLREHAVYIESLGKIVGREKTQMMLDTSNILDFIAVLEELKDNLYEIENRLK